MYPGLTLKSVGIVACVLALLSQAVLMAPSNQDYDNMNIRDLYEYLMEREMLANHYNQQHPVIHRVVRKNTRSPSLRLRFGRRSDPSFSQVATSNEDYNNFRNYADAPIGE